MDKAMYFTKEGHGFESPQTLAASISIGVVPPNGIVLEVCIVGECGDATTEA